MKSTATTIDEYLESLAEERRVAICAVREAILSNLPVGFEECMQYGMISYVVPHALYPAGYHADPTLPLVLASLGSQKNHMALYLMCVYADESKAEWLKNAFEARGKKLDMGKGCLRFKRLEALPLDVIGELFAGVSVEKYVEQYVNARLTHAQRRRDSAKA